jgi:RNA polymerase sigma-70 factor (ECF subfamily)
MEVMGTPTGHDIELVARAQEGDLPAFEALVRQTQQQVYGFARRLVPDAEEARDLTQQTFLQAFTHLRGFRGQSRFRTWLFKIAANLCYDYLRSRSRQGNPVAVEDLALAGGNSPENDLIAQDDQVRVQRALAGLSPKQRAVVHLRLEQELSYEEISRIVGGTAGAARVNYSQALKALRERLRAEDER